MDSNSSCREIVDSDEDVFDRLPHEVVLSIFNKLQDAKSLCSSMSVCKRFRSIAPQIDRVFLQIPNKKQEFDRETHKNSFKNVVIKTLMKPFSFVSQMLKFKPKNEEHDLDFYSYYVPNRVLKSFREIRGLHLRLPCHGNQKQGSKTGKNSSKTFLKWKAEFGGELHSCVILGAKSWAQKRPDQENPTGTGQESRVMSDDELKLRIVWTISCLIAASARHYLIQQTVRRCETIEDVVVSDESGQGRLCMNREQIEEMRELKADQVSAHRSRVPALRMKMWYLERLECSGKVMEGATLVVIRPAAAADGAEVGRRSDAGVVAGAFGEEGEGEVLGEVVRRLMVAKKCYSLEMSSF